jgi:hypothetical protein
MNKRNGNVNGAASKTFDIRSENFGIPGPELRPIKSRSSLAVNSVALSHGCFQRWQRTTLTVLGPLSFLS